MYLSPLSSRGSRARRDWAVLHVQKLEFLSDDMASRQQHSASESRVLELTSVLVGRRASRSLGRFSRRKCRQQGRTCVSVLVDEIFFAHSARRNCAFRVGEKIRARRRDTSRRSFPPLLFAQRFFVATSTTGRNPSSQFPRRRRRRHRFHGRRSPMSMHLFALSRVGGRRRSLLLARLRSVSS